VCLDLEVLLSGQSPIDMSMLGKCEIATCRVGWMTEMVSCYAAQLLFYHSSEEVVAGMEEKVHLIFEDKLDSFVPMNHYMRLKDVETVMTASILDYVVKRQKYLMAERWDDCSKESGYECLWAIHHIRSVERDE
jgi:hypothetical protein